MMKRSHVNATSRGIQRRMSVATAVCFALGASWLLQHTFLAAFSCLSPLRETNLAVRSERPVLHGRAALTGGARSAAHPSASSARGEVALAADRQVYMAVVDVDVFDKDLDPFLDASIENARQSVKEDTNLRFDVMQSTDDVTKFALVEIYGSAEGPVKHKATEHYNTWRETVADMMASPRSATQWDTVFPQYGYSLKPNVLVLERDIPTDLDITHVYIEVNKNDVEAFMDATIKQAEMSLQEKTVMRYDIYRNVDKPTQFLLVEVFAVMQHSDAHKMQKYYVDWLEQVTPMFFKDPEEKHYVNHFPSVPGAWRRDGGGMLSGLFR
mmetsp:Transcript_66109/g.158156  ORF Transcript_66109/g.158156 Transcript_66109/m.158156 type:complete len:326 (+) Transcript_66109:84-1061(+)